MLVDGQQRDMISTVPFPCLLKGARGRRSLDTILLLFYFFLKHTCYIPPFPQRQRRSVLYLAQILVRFFLRCRRKGVRKAFGGFQQGRKWRVRGGGCAPRLVVVWEEARAFKMMRGGGGGREGGSHPLDG